MKRKVEKGKPWQGKRQYSVVPLFWKSVKRSVFYNWLTRFQTPAETKMVVRMLAAFGEVPADPMDRERMKNVCPQNGLGIRRCKDGWIFFCDRHDSD